MGIRIRMFASVLLMLSIGVRGQKRSAHHAITKDEAIDMVMRLPEVKDANAYVLHHSKDKRKLFPMIYGEPTNKQPYWWVAVGEDNGMSFVTHFGFLVYIKSGKIFYYDTIEGMSIDLRTWRKNGRKR